MIPAAVTLRGYVARGAGVAAGFTALPWVREQLLRLTGTDPHPGTFNLELRDPQQLQAWLAARARFDLVLEPPDRAWCRARCARVRIAGRHPGAIVAPEIRGYPEDRVEIVASLGLRAALGVADGTGIDLEIPAPLAHTTVLFDVDGTLVDSIPAHRLIAEAAAAPYGFAITDAHMRAALSTAQGNFWDQVVPPGYPDRESLFQALHAAAWREAPRIIRDHARPFPDLAQTLGALARRGTTLAIMTGSAGHTLHVLEDAGLLARFRAVVTGKDVARRKPDPEGLLLCCERLGVDPSAALYVGDAEIDVCAARAAGMTAVAVLSGAGTSADLAQVGADFLIPDHRALPALFAPVP
jgi:HAD superfamily hydrolase (TIGR01509 family)